ncbi:MAG: hypothetical protein FGF52_04235 [Candidatus Brockarchaeota archaeon]|nr:hypothetical protein [Candidatus Brockarchaeota archaeon]
MVLTRLHRSWRKWDPAFKNYAEFERVLDGFVRLFGELPECVADGRTRIALSVNVIDKKVT